MDFLDDFELALIRQDVRDLTQDAQIGGSVIYQSWVSKGTFDPNTSTISTVYAGTWVNTYKMPVAEDEIIRSDGHYQMGDYRYCFSCVDIITPKKDDRIIDGTTRYIIGFTTDSIESFHAIVLRNLG